MLKLLKFLQVLLAVSMMFSDSIFLFAVYCFTNIVSIVKVSLSEKSKDSNLKESIEFRVKLNHNFSETYLELCRTFMIELFVKIVNA